MTEKELLGHLDRGCRASVEDRAEELWRTPVERATGSEWYLEGTARKPRRRGRLYRTVGALAACLALVISLIGWRALRPVSTVYLDVNPSVSVAIDRHDRVVRAEALNADGEAILAGMNLKKVDVDVAVNALLGSMVKNGYLGSERGVVLLSVESEDPERARALSESLSDGMEACLASLLRQNRVYYQVLSDRYDTEDLEETYGISAGKATMLLKLLEKDPTLDVGQLAGLSMEDLASLLRQNGIALGDLLPYKGSALFDEDDWDDLFDDVEEPDDDDADRDGDDAPYGPRDDDEDHDGDDDPEDNDDDDLDGDDADDWDDE
jgi:hypothetical protein